MCEYETNGCGCGNNYCVNDRGNGNGCYNNNNGCGVLNCFSDNTLLIIAIIILFILLFCRGNNCDC